MTTYLGDLTCPSSNKRCSWSPDHIKRSAYPSRTPRPRVSVQSSPIPLLRPSLDKWKRKPRSTRAARYTFSRQNSNIEAQAKRTIRSPICRPRSPRRLSTTTSICHSSNGHRTSSLIFVPYSPGLSSHLFPPPSPLHAGSSHRRVIKRGQTLLDRQ